MKKFYGLVLGVFFGLTVLVAVSTVSAAEEKSQKGGAQLWSENCAKCHNTPSPASRSDREWAIIVHHMRVRANMTAEESKKILEFLKSAN